MSTKPLPDGEALEEDLWRRGWKPPAEAIAMSLAEWLARYTPPDALPVRYTAELMDLHAQATALAALAAKLAATVEYVIAATSGAEKWPPDHDVRR